MDLDCPFCTLPPERVWLEDEGGVAAWDGYPAAQGHTLVLPRRHVECLWDLDRPEQAGLWDLVARARARLEDRYAPDGFTVGVNDGLAAGQTIPHAHIHVIPRHLGDVADPTGGLRGILPNKARYWEG
ncbi:MAG: HIT family protein [Gemmatimonadota bacterium]|nr:HIT family protein [Gemmatimonadota bacterium]